MNSIVLSQPSIPMQLSSVLFTHSNPSCECKIGTDFSSTGTPIFNFYIRKTNGEHQFTFTSKDGLLLCEGQGKDMTTVPVIEKILSMDVEDETAVQSLFHEFGYLFQLNSEDYIKIPFAEIQPSLIAYQNLVKLINEIAKLDTQYGNYNSVIALIFYFLFRTQSESVSEVQSISGVGNAYKQNMFSMSNTIFDSNYNHQTLMSPQNSLYDFYKRWNTSSAKTNEGWEKVRMLPNDYNDEPIDMSDRECDLGNYHDYYDGIETVEAYAMTDSLISPDESEYLVTDDDIDEAHRKMCQGNGFREKAKYLFYTKNKGEDFLNGVIDLLYHLPDGLKDKEAPITEIDKNGQIKWIGKLDHEWVATRNRMSQQIRSLANTIIKCEFDQNLYGKVQPEYSTETLSPNWTLGDLNTALYFALFYRNSNDQIYRKCANPDCNNYFMIERTDKKKKYCTPNCNNKVQQRKFQNKKKLETLNR